MDASQQKGKSRQLRLAIATIVVLGGAAAALFVWRPWKQPAPTTTTQPLRLQGDIGALLEPAHLVTVTPVNRSSHPCKLTLEAAGVSSQGSWTSNVPERVSDVPFVFAGPSTINTVIIEHDGQSLRQEVGVTLPPGSAHELRIDQDETVQVVAVGE